MEILQNELGMTLPKMSSGSGSDNKHLYNGKELEDDFNLNWYHYGARHYDPQLGKPVPFNVLTIQLGWLQSLSCVVKRRLIDPADEFHSPYVYVGNMPTIAVDPDGKAVYALREFKSGGIVNFKFHYKVQIIDKTGKLTEHELQEFQKTCNKAFEEELPKNINNPKIVVEVTTEIVLGDHGGKTEGYNEIIIDDLPDSIENGERFITLGQAKGYSPDYFEVNSILFATSFYKKQTIRTLIHELLHGGKVEHVNDEENIMKQGGDGMEINPYQINQFWDRMSKVFGSGNLSKED